MLHTGITHRIEQEVRPEMSAARVGSGLADVLATPAMIALAERTCYESVVPYLEEGLGTVGTLVNIKHLSATPIGMSVWCESELVEVDRRRLLFAVKVYDRCGLIGEGWHERFVVDTAQFEAKTAAKFSQ